MPLNYFDIAVVVILALFSIRGLLRGFVGEVAGVAAIIGGLWYAHRSFMQFAVYLDFIKDPTWRNITAYVLVFLGVLLLVGIVARILRHILAFSFVSWADKIAGFTLGLIKGLRLCAVLLLCIRYFMGDAPFLRDSRLLPYLTLMMDYVRAHLPPDIVSKIPL